MDDVRAREDMPQLDGRMVEEETLDQATRRYLGRLARTHPFSLKFDAPAPLITQELAMRWPIDPNAEQQASNLRHRIEGFIKPLAETIHPAVTMRLVVNVGSHPQVQAPFPDAPAVYAAFDASRGTVRHRLAAANEIPLDTWGENVPRGMTLLCQPIENKTEPFGQDLGQGGNLYALTSLEQNETADWRRAHNRAVIVPMMPLTAKASYEEIPQDPQHHDTFLSKAALAAASLFIGEEVADRFDKHPSTNTSNATKVAAGVAAAKLAEDAFHMHQKENDEKQAAQNKADSDKMAEKNRNDAAEQAEQAAMARTEYLLNEVRRDERLIRENPQLSSELEALMGSVAQLRGTLHTGPDEAQAEADINAAETELTLEKEPETSYDESSNPEQIFLGMPEKETEVQESEQAREDAEHFPQEITQPGEYARIADLNPDAADELTAEQPGVRQYAVNEDMVQPGVDTGYAGTPRRGSATAVDKIAATAAPQTTISEAANEATLSPEAAAERAQAIAPEVQATRAAQEIGGVTEASETTVAEPATESPQPERAPRATATEQSSAETTRSENEPKATAPQHEADAATVSPQHTSTEQLPEQPEAVYQGHETPAEPARSASKPQTSASRHEPSAVETAQSQPAAAESVAEQPVQQTVAESTERTAPSAEPSQESAPAASNEPSAAEETSTPQEESDGFHHMLNVHHLNEAASAGPSDPQRITAPTVSQAPSGIMAKAGPVKAAALAGRLRPARKAPSARKARAAPGTKTASPKTTRRPRQKPDTSVETKPGPEPGV